jgi:hypothetical protein
MGWHIGRGVKFTTTNIFEIERGLAQWRETLKALTHAKILDLYANTSQRNIDDALAREKPMPTRVLSGVYQEMMDSQREIKKTGYRNPDYDFDFEVSIIPYDGAVYGIIRCEHNEWINKFMRLGLVKHFWWHDNERPGSVPSAEWKHRGEVWKTIFDKDARPAGHGFNAELTTPTYMVRDITDKNVATKIKRTTTFDKRLHRVAVNIVTDKRIHLDPEFLEQQAKADPGVSHYISAAHRAASWLKTEHGQVALELEKAYIAKLLPLEITADML